MIGPLGRMKIRLNTHLTNISRFVHIPMLKSTMQLNPLTKQEEDVIVHKGTEPPFTGEYDDFYKDGIYVCRRCELPLYDSQAKFNAGCGWPSFDDTFPDSVERYLDADGVRTEITCSRCNAHLGHVFEGESFTDKDTRHCVNSLSIKFVPR